ncbi:5-aminoimidazole-4-carboxamide ribonucleotide transformylase [Kribbella sp. CA-293567]|uniref:5-aminoimidazole-4-carboxamide ribonucleotide transformylase n=1 Tax=Kribbella sp. CA-293567 TaxID=3002436 RepID=UPI0022DDE44C|nr:5-aminoimidazole-4-carboxamide ribonucleotide transformylase [Kribbella sp. CA-293567]WBQ07557.1 5-aminoimidazole-4-carboxamide ribonucleotide transformylase [Kribbella sp. CA-293567]
MHLRYGINPHQPATVSALGPSPFTVLHGSPSYINVLDAANAWQLVREARHAFGVPAATSFKHVSPAGAALAGPLDETIRTTYAVGTTSPVTSAYLRARDADPKSSYGDFVAVSHPVDRDLADVLRRLTCDGIIAPGYDAGVVGTLSAKKRGTFLILEADPAFEPPLEEVRELYGLRLTQHRDAEPLTRSLLVPDLPDQAARDLLLGLIVLRYTQSNSIALLKDGMAIGIGAGQQSRIDCTRLAGQKADTWWLRRAITVRSDLPLSARIAHQLAEVDRLSAVDRAAWLDRLTEVAMTSDGAIPFADNIDEAHRHGVRHLAEPGGSIRSAEVTTACAAVGMTLSRTGIRLFHH